LSTFYCLAVLRGGRLLLLLLLIGCEDMLMVVEVFQSPTPAALSAVVVDLLTAAGWQSGDGGVGVAVASAKSDHTASRPPAATVYDTI